MEENIIIIGAFVVAAIVSWFLVPRILFIAFQKKLFDVPDSRKIHTGIVPRLGGVTFFPVFVLVFMMTFAFMSSFCDSVKTLINNDVVAECSLLICGMTIIFLVGIGDDLVGVSSNKKFMAQILAAMFIPLSGFWINNWYGLFGVYELPVWIGMPFTVFVTVLITNAINLIDGLDGLASGLCMIALLSIGGVFFMDGVWIYALIAAIMLGEVLPFFMYNVFGSTLRRTKIFMGDTGSLMLGYVISFILIRYVFCEHGITAGHEGRFMIALSLIFVPIFDVLRVMTVRVRKGVSPFLPDQNHIHHKFLAVRFSKAQTLCSILFIDVLHIAVTVLLLEIDIDVNIVFVANLLLWFTFNVILSRVRASRKAENKQREVFIR
ncbi:MAG: undecaprenyl/decaprenyl-phosphate alpha-N-acetylglucosaminyl 1-phosphate transferase [Flavobacteriales bacterium]|nr:undecaprenyl/decaprenyl-phosphate alpha-N-acetylglucosaminyl 1-phosphate transferase [Flavobacteriales bacterium]